MASNSRLAIAIHTAGVIAVSGEFPIRSELIAGSVKTNPVVIRRIIRKLTRNGLVEVRKGSGGGARLSRPAAEISLADIFDAMGEDPLFQVPVLAEDHPCPLGRAVRPILSGILGGAERSLREHLAKISLSDVMELVKGRLDADECAANPNVK